MLYYVPATAEENPRLRKIAAVFVLLLVLTVIGVTSSRQVAGEFRIVSFPLEDDSWNVKWNPVWSVEGDNVTGTREINITDIIKVEISLKLEANTASDAKPHVFEVSLNSKPVGTFNVGKSMGLEIKTTLEFDPIETNGLVLITYELIDVDGGGLIMKADGSSTITLSDGLAPKTKKDFALRALRELKELRENVDQSGIDQGPKRSLLSKLDRAIAKMDQALVYIDKGDEQKANNKLRTAKNSVGSFVRALDAFSERITPQYSEYWENEARKIINLIEKAIETPI